MITATSDSYELTINGTNNVRTSFTAQFDCIVNLIIKFGISPSSGFYHYRGAVELSRFIQGGSQLIHGNIFMKTGDTILEVNIGQQYKIFAVRVN